MSSLHSGQIHLLWVTSEVCLLWTSGNSPSAPLDLLLHVKKYFRLFPLDKHVTDWIIIVFRKRIRSDYAFLNIFSPCNQHLGHHDASCCETRRHGKLLVSGFLRTGYHLSSAPLPRLLCVCEWGCESQGEESVPLLPTLSVTFLTNLAVSDDLVFCVILSHAGILSHPAASARCDAWILITVGCGWYSSPACWVVSTVFFLFADWPNHL